MIVWDDGKWVDLKLILERCEESNSADVYGNHRVTLGSAILNWCTDKRGCSGIIQFELNMWIQNFLPM